MGLGRRSFTSSWGSVVWERFGLLGISTAPGILVRVTARDWEVFRLRDGRV